MNPQTLIKPLFCALLALQLTACQAQQSKPTNAANPKPKTTVQPLVWQALDEPGSGGTMTDIAVSPHDSQRILLAGDMLGVGLSLDRGDSWLPSFGFKSYEIARFTWHPTDPNTVWVGTMSGPYVSHDGGVNWVEKRDGMGKTEWGRYSAPIEKVLFDPNDVQHLIAIGGSSRGWGEKRADGANWGRIWDSRDGGDSWKMLTILQTDGTTTNDPKIIGDNIVWAVFSGQSSSKLYAIGVDSGFLISEDGGQSWKQSNTGLPPMNSKTGGIWNGVIHRAVFAPNNPSTLWVGVNNYVPPGQTKRVPGGVYKSVDGGQNWVESSNGLAKFESDNPNLASRYKAIAIAPSAPNVLYTNDSSWSTGVVYKSVDGGQNWTPLATRKNGGREDNDTGRAKLFQVETAIAAGLGMFGLEVDPNDANAVYGLGFSYIPRTLDGGKTWDDATSYRPAGKVGWRGRGYAGWVATNFSFNPYKKGESILQAMDSARVWVSDNDLQSWQTTWTNPGPYGGGYDVTWTPNGRLYATSGQGEFSGIGRSLDGGKTWENLAGEKFGLPARNAKVFTRGIYALPNDPMRVWATVGGKLYGSTDGGDRWKVVLDKPGLLWLAGDPKTPSRFYVSGAQGIYLTDDGSNFTLIGGPKIAKGGKLSGHLTVDGNGRVYVASFNPAPGPETGLWRYDSADQVWVRLREDNMIANVAVDPTDANRVAVITTDQPFHDETRATGVWLSDDAGKTWRSENKGLPMLRGDAIAIDPHDPERLVVGTTGRGFWITRWAK